jgi:Brp/Blh family beta-carotene 15,15'-monooxygenase
LSILVDQLLPLPQWRKRQFSFLRQQKISTWLLLLVAALISAGALIGGHLSLSIDLAFILLLGLPHGALDVELARHLLRRRWRKSWFTIFAIPYLTLAGGVLLAWHFLPVLTLGFFLAMSVLHFGEDRRLNLWQVMAKGGAPIALPILFHPAETVALLNVFAQAPLGNFALWLNVAAYLWLGLFGILSLWSFNRQAGILLREVIVLALLYAVFPPLPALTLYFVCYHSPSHVQELIADRVNTPRITSIRQAILFSAPVTGLTLLLGATLLPLYHGPWLVRMTALTFQGLAALTLPHMLLNGYIYKTKNAD